MRSLGLCLTLLLGCLVSLSDVRAAPPPLEAFFEGAQIRSVSISPDSRFLAMIAAAEGKTFVAVKDRTGAAPALPVLAASENNSFEPRWCRWANTERLLCSFIGRERHKVRDKILPLTRLVAVNADGTQQKVLQKSFTAGRQYQDRIIDWTPDDPKTVLIECIRRGCMRTELIHGTEDYTVEPDQTELMADALRIAGKPFQKVMIEGTDHYFLNQSHEKLLITSMTNFLEQHLKPVLVNAE